MIMIVRVMQIRRVPMFMLQGLMGMHMAMFAGYFGVMMMIVMQVVMAVPVLMRY